MIDQSQYLKDRIDDQTAWYGKKSRQNKNWYRRLRVISIIISLSIPILASLIGKSPESDGKLKIVIAIAGALVALIEGLMSLNKYHDLWTTYRATGEGLKYHRYLFETETAPYDTPNAFKLFVQNAEGLMASEHTNWMQLAAEKPAEKKGNNNDNKREEGGQNAKPV